MTKKEILTKYVKEVFNAKKPYVFISYSHSPEDVDKVYTLLMELMKYGINFVLDVEYGYKGGSWVNMMTDRIATRNCKLMLACYSDNYVYSRPSLIEQFYRFSDNTVEAISDELQPLKSLPIGMLKSYAFNDKIVDTIRARINRPAEEDDFDFSLSTNEAKCLDEGLCGYKGYIIDGDNEEEKNKIDKKYKDRFKSFSDKIKAGGKDVSDDSIDDVRKVFQFFINNLQEGTDNVKQYTEHEQIASTLIDTYKIACLDEIKAFAKEYCSQINETNTPSTEPKKTPTSSSTEDKGKTAPSIKPTTTPVADIPKVDSYPTKITQDMTLSEFEKLFEDDKFVLYIRWFRNEGCKGVSKQFIDYIMSALLRGCDEKVNKNDAKWKYCTYAVSSNLDINNLTMGASQFTWQTSSRHAVNISGSGKLGENSAIFANLSANTTIGEIQKKFESNEVGFVTKDNTKIELVFNALYQ